MWNIDTKLFELGEYRNWRVSPSVRGTHKLYNLYIPSTYGLRINGNEFVSGLVNAKVLEDPDTTPLVDGLISNLQNTHRLITSLLQRFSKPDVAQQCTFHRLYGCS